MPPHDAYPGWHALSVPKHGHTAAEYEDAWAADSLTGRFAVADGATESSFAALWAGLLADGFVAALPSQEIDDWLDGQRHKWAAEVMGLDLPWFAEMKREEGACATYLGLTLRLPTLERPGLWRAEAVGDSCVVRVRKGRHVRAFPLKTAAEFSNRPRLIGSRGGEKLRPERTSGSLLAGDQLFMMTDALAEWFLRTHERGGLPWEAVADLLAAERPDEAFAAVVAGLREGGALRNDDVTLLVLTIESPTGHED